MPISINDLIENFSSTTPTIRGAQNQVTGWLYAEVGGTASNGWNITAGFRDLNSAVVSGSSIYIFNGSSTSDAEWQNATKWVEVSGASGGIDLTDLSVDTQTPASTTTSSLTYDNTTGEFDFTPIDITGKQDTLTGTGDVPGLTTALGLKADKQTITQSGGTIQGTINTTAGTFSLTAPTVGGGDALTTAGLDQFDSVTFTSLADVDIMMYDNATSDWINVPPAGHKAVWYGSGSTGEVITWDGTTWNAGTLAYSDLSGLPVLGTVATTNAYGDLSGLPVFGTVATTNNYSDLGQLPTFVAGTNVTIQTATNGAGGTQYTIASSGTGTGATSLAGLSDVLIPSPANGEVLTYNGATSEWNSGPISFPVTGVSNLGTASGGGSLALIGSVIQYVEPDLTSYAETANLGNSAGLDVGTTAGTVAAGDDARLSDARTPTPHTHTHVDITDFDVEVNTLASSRIAASNIGNLGNVSSTAPSTGQVLKWDGSEWAPGTDNTGGGGSVTDLNDITIGGVTTDLGTFSNNPGQIIWYDSVATDWVYKDLNWALVNKSNSSIFDIADVSPNPLNLALAPNQVLAYAGTDWTNFKVALESLSMTMAGDPPDDNYYMTIRMPCGATVTDIKSVATGSSPSYDYTIYKENGGTGVIGTGTATALHATETGVGTTVSSPTVTTTTIVAADVIYIEIANASGCDQITFNVEYEPALRAI
jgi:hypothetical protein